MIEPIIGKGVAQALDVEHENRLLRESNITLTAQLAALRDKARGKVYQMCATHRNSAWPMLKVTYAAPPIQVCPLCDASEKAEEPK